MKKTILSELAIAVFLTTTVSAASARIIFVDKNAPGANNGSSWQNAYICLQDALADAQSGDDIRVAKGVYRPDEYIVITEQFGPQLKCSGDRADTFQLKDGIAIKGGYAGYGEPDPDDHDILAYETILSGDLSGDDSSDFVTYGENSYHVVSCGPASADTVLDGFTIVGGNTDGSWPGSGGGMIVGGAGSPTLIKCNFRQNRAGQYGGGIHLIGSRSLITYCTFTGNSAKYGGAAYIYSGAPTLINCIFSANSADSGGALCITNSMPFVANCTVAHNSATSSGGGICISGNAEVRLTNCIVWDNSASRGWQIALEGYSNLVITYSDLKSTWKAVFKEWDATLDWGVGNIDADPMFVDSAGKDYHLQLGSPCINAGDPTHINELPEMDIDGQPRIINARIDVGAYEYAYEGPVLRLSPTRLEFRARPNGPNPDPQLLAIANAGTGVLTWQIAEDCPWLSVYPKAGVCKDKPTEVSLTVDISHLTVGAYNSCLIVTATGALQSPKTVTVNLYVHDRLHVPSAYPTIQAAIDAASKADTVIVAPGTYTGDGNRDIDFKGKAITVRSTDPNDPNVVKATVIDCQGTNTDRHRGFYFHRGEGPDSALAGLTITNGYAPNVAIEGYMRSSGGAICCIDSSPKITNCIITHNEAGGNDGGGLCYLNSSGAFIANCVIADNSASVSGGGISFYNSMATVSNCIITHNAARSSAGGLLCTKRTAATVQHCTFVGNSAGYGGAVGCRGSDCIVSHCILWGNSAASGGSEISVATTYPSGRSHATITHSNLLPASPTAVYRSESSTILWDIGNIHTDPHLIDPDAGNYHLSAISPCINTGDPAYIPTYGKTDIDGETRVMAGRVDIGADEFTSTLTPYLAVAPTEIRFHADQGGANPQPQTLFIRNTGSSILNWQISLDCLWLSAYPIAGASVGDINQVTLNVDISRLVQGSHSCNLIITSADAHNSPRTVPVTLRIFLEGRFYVPREFKTVQAAIDWAEDGDTIIIAPGTYTGPGNRDIDFCGKAVTVRSIDPDNWKTVKSTVIDCQSTENEQHRGFYFHSGEDANSVIMGLTIINARASYGAAIRCEDQSSPTITKCLLTKNMASWGAGISSQESSPTIDNCAIVDNVSYDCGLHLYISGHPIVANCTIAYNLSDREPPSVWFSQPDATISNCIVWFNSVPRSPLHGTFTYCNIEGGRPGIGNIDAGPLFADPENGDYHLLPDSPCIDAGDPNFIALPGQTDIDGEPRVFNGRIDMGADELFYEGPLIALSARRFEFSAYEGGKNPDARHLAIYNRGLDTLNWQITEDCPWLEVTPMTGVSSGELNEVTLSVDVSGLPGGLYECELIISDAAGENSPRIVPVTLYVVGPLIDLSASGFEFVAEEGGANPEDQTLTIANSGGGILDWTIDYDCNWLEVTPTAASSRGEVNEVTLSVDTSALQRGAYNCQLTVSDPNSVNSPQTVEVSLYVTAELVRVPSQFPTIQRAVDFVLQGGTVLVADGIYAHQGNRDINFRGKAITVRSEHGPENCIIDCNAAYPEWHHGFYFRSGEDSNSVLSGFTIINAKGGGIVCESRSSPMIINCRIGASDTTTAKRWQSNGPGIRCANYSNPTIKGCSIVGNVTWDGAGIECYKSDPTIANCIISKNTACGTPMIIIVPGAGGGILCDQSNPRITSCLITNNRADCGGGIYCANSNPIIKNCLIAGNGDLGSYGDRRDPEGGGGIYCNASNPMITNCTFTSNVHNYGKGGAIYSFNGSNPIISNCILWDNDATDGSQIALVTYEHYTGKKIYSAASVNYSNIQHSAAMQRRDEQKRDFYDEDLLRALEAVHIDVGCQLKWENGNIDADPLFVQVGYWDTNDIRDTWDDFWVAGNYHLKSEGWRWDTQRKIWTWDDVTSPCIDAGNPGSPLGEELLTIPADPNKEWGRNIRINMGAYAGTEQASMPPYNWSLLADLTNDGIVDWHDFTHAASDWLAAANEQPGDLNRDAVLDFTDLALLAEDWLRKTTWHE